jgi:hypothetical protein
MTHERIIVVALALSVLAAAPAVAQEWRGHRGERDWRDHDIHRFHEHDFARWRGGRWWHGWHDGRSGWWWIVGPAWYWYPAPVYPFPDPYLPPAVAPAPPGPGPRVYYWCDNPQGYYPYVPQCLAPWRALPMP